MPAEVVGCRGAAGTVEVFDFVLGRSGVDVEERSRVT